MLLNNTYRLLFVNSKLVRFSHVTSEVLLPMKKLNIISYARSEYRNTIMSKIENATTTCGGYIDDFNFFSDLATSLRILGIRQPDTLKQFYERLKLDINELELDVQTIKTLDDCSSSTEQYLLFILFQILFIDAKGNLRRDVPAFNS